MFFLRCAFWLSIVYASMSWSGEALQHAASSVDAGPVSATQVAKAVVLPGAATFCSGREAQCFKDAVAMTALVHKAMFEGEDAGRDLPPDAAVPMPIPRPRGLFSRTS